MTTMRVNNRGRLSIGDPIDRDEMMVSIMGLIIVKDGVVQKMFIEPTSSM